jgi:hypothetical protein
MKLIAKLNEKELADLVAAIGSHLGIEWRLVEGREPCSWYKSLFNTDDPEKGLGFRYSYLSGMLDVHGTWPKDVRKQEHSPHSRFSIGCSVSKGAERIAKDITRRFMSWYLPEYAKQKARCHDFSVAQDSQAAMMRELAPMLCDPSRCNFDRGECYDYPVRIRVSCAEKPSIDLELHSMGYEQARAVILAYLAHKPKEEDNA